MSMTTDLINPNPLGCVQNRIQIGGFGTVRVNLPLPLTELRVTHLP